jgi:hypothetical protein
MPHKVNVAGARLTSEPMPAKSEAYNNIPVVPHKAVAEVSKIGNL